jgi:hypothetical protein
MPKIRQKLEITKSLSPGRWSFTLLRTVICSPALLVGTFAVRHSAKRCTILRLASLPGEDSAKGSCLTPEIPWAYKSFFP